MKMNKGTTDRFDANGNKLWIGARVKIIGMEERIKHQPLAPQYKLTLTYGIYVGILVTVIESWEDNKQGYVTIETVEVKKLPSIRMGIHPKHLRLVDDSAETKP